MDLFYQMKDTHHIRAVQNRISSLLKQNVIDEQLVSFTKTSQDECPPPKILVALEKLVQQKRFSGLEVSVRRVCELIEQGRDVPFSLD